MIKKLKAIPAKKFFIATLIYIIVAIGVVLLLRTILTPTEHGIDGIGAALLQAIIIKVAIIAFAIIFFVLAVINVVKIAGVWNELSLIWKIGIAVAAVLIVAIPVTPKIVERIQVMSYTGESLAAEIIERTESGKSYERKYNGETVIDGGIYIDRACSSLSLKSQIFDINRETQIDAFENLIAYMKTLPLCGKTYDKENKCDVYTPAEIQRYSIDVRHGVVSIVFDGYTYQYSLY